MAVPAASTLAFVVLALKQVGAAELGQALLVLAMSGTAATILSGWLQHATLRFAAQAGDEVAPRVLEILLVSTGALMVGAAFQALFSAQHGLMLVLPLDVAYRLCQARSQYQGDARRYAKTSVSFALVRLAALLVLARSVPNGAAIWAHSLGLAAGILSGWGPRRDGAIRLRFRGFAEYRRWLSYGVPVSLVGVFGEFRPLAERAVVASDLGLAAVGEYATAVSLGLAAVGLVSQPLMLDASPRILRMGSGRMANAMALRRLLRVESQYMGRVAAAILGGLLVAPELLDVAGVGRSIIEALPATVAGGYLAALSLYVGKRREISASTALLSVPPVVGAIATTTAIILLQRGTAPTISTLGYCSLVGSICLLATSVMLSGARTFMLPHAARLVFIVVAAICTLVVYPLLLEDPLLRWGAAALLGGYVLAGVRRATPWGRR